MRGLDHTRSRLPRTRAFFAGVAFLAGAIVPVTAGAQATGTDETAMAVPRLAPPDGNAGVALPQPLTPSDAALVRQAFALQARGQIAAADRDIDALQSDLLVGPLLAERYLGRFHHTTAAELTAWLQRYADQPDAPEIRALLLRRLPKGATPPRLPPAVTAHMTAPMTARMTPPRTAAAAPRLAAAPAATARPAMAPPTPQPALEQAVRARAEQGSPAAALRLIAARKSLSPADASLLRGEVARALFVRNDDAAALHVAEQAQRVTPPGDDVGLAAYVGGLAAWRLGDPAQARQWFAAAAEAPRASPHRQAAAAFWTARAAERTHDPGDAVHWLRRAARHRTTLHGLIARRLLGLPTGIMPSGALLSQADVDAVAATDAGWRAFALLQVGQRARAAAELRALWRSAANDKPLRHALILVAAGVGLTDCAAQLAAWNAAAEQSPGEAGQYAVPPLHPTGGFRVDPALVYAVARVESNFDPHAVSSAGARGLMQLMPETALYLARHTALADVPWHEPAVNLELGQRYMLFLAAQPPIDGDLLRLLASYNAGPGSFLRWNGAIRDLGDPLLFIEAIPNGETRRFVEATLTDSWIYAARLHVPAPSLDAMEAGRFPRFTPPADGRTIEAAWLH